HLALVRVVKPLPASPHPRAVELLVELADRFRRGDGDGAHGFLVSWVGCFRPCEASLLSASPLHGVAGCAVHVSRITSTLKRLRFCRGYVAEGGFACLRRQQWVSSGWPS